MRGIPKFLLDQRHRLEPKLEEIDDSWEDLLNVVAWTAIYMPSLEIFQSSTPSKHGKEIIIWGECDDFRGIDTVRNLLEIKSGTTLIITGGNYGREKTLGESGSLDMWEVLQATLKSSSWDRERISEIKSSVIIDSFSRHTGHQRELLGNILCGLAPKEVAIVQPRYHITRFLMSLGANLYEQDFSPRIHPVPYGSWNLQHTGRGPRENADYTFTYEELLALPPTPSRQADIMNCGELDKIIQYAHPDERQCLTFREARKWLGI